MECHRRGTEAQHAFAIPANSWEERLVRIVVDYDLCESNALCVVSAPELFEIRDDDSLYVLDESPGEDLRAKAEAAVRACPKQAIKITD